MTPQLFSGGPIARQAPWRLTSLTSSARRLFSYELGQLSTCDARREFEGIRPRGEATCVTHRNNAWRGNSRARQQRVQIRIVRAYGELRIRFDLAGDRFGKSFAVETDDGAPWPRMLTEDQTQNLMGTAL